MVMFNSYVKLAEGMKKNLRDCSAGHEKNSPNVWQRDNEHSVFQTHNVGFLWMVGFRLP